MKGHEGRPAVVLLAEDSHADQTLVRRGFKRARIHVDLHIVGDGIEALRYLRREGPYADPTLSPEPDIVLLDINMPRLDGREVLRAIRSDPVLKPLPVIILTTSEEDRDVIESYRLGVNAYISKPIEPAEFIAAIEKLDMFWLQLVILPPHSSGSPFFSSDPSSSSPRNRTHSPPGTAWEEGQ